MAEKELTATLEDYLEAIYEISKARLVAQASQIAERLRVAKSSVSWALNQLGQRELVNYTPYEVVSLTAKGRALGERLARRHGQIKGFLIDVLALDEKLADDNACRLEHVLDRDVLERMRQFVEFLEACPRAGREWMHGLGAFCHQGRLPDNCPPCVQECLDRLPAPAGAPEAVQPLPKLSKPRDRDLIGRLNQVLHEAGHALAPEHADVIEAFMQTERHQTPQTILQAARRRNPRITEAAAAEAMQVLCEHQLARSLLLGDQVLYEHYHPESHHDHVFCVRCGAIVEFYDPRIEQLQRENARWADFRLLTHQLNLYGVCRECIHKERRTRTLAQGLAGEQVEVVRLPAEPAVRKRLTDLGLTPGVVAEVLNPACAGGGVLVRAGQARVMVDRDTAARTRIMGLPAGALPPGPERPRHLHRADRAHRRARPQGTRP